MKEKLTQYSILLLIVFCLVSEGARGGLLVEESFSGDNWERAEKIREQVTIPKFPKRVFDIRDYGAVENDINIKKNTEAINKAIKECSNKGGGVVLVPTGIFKTGAIHLENNVNLKISEGGELLFSTNPDDYLPVVETSWEGILCQNYSPLIYANNKKNIAVTGEGLLNGMASDQDWWGWIPLQRNENNRPLLDKLNTERIPVSERTMGNGHYLRPQFMQFYKCKNILVEGVTVKNSPFWVIHPLFCKNITVRGITVNSLGPNNDGCDPESCKNVLIEDCVFNTGDDCIALKSGRNEDGRQLKTPIEKVVVRGCQMKSGHGGIVIGSEVSGGARNIFAEDCKMDSPFLERAIRIKTSSQRGGVVEGIFIRNIEVGEVSDAVILINCKYGNPGNYPPVVRDIYISGIKSQKANYGIRMRGLEGYSCIEDVNIKDCDFKGTQIPEKVEFVKGLVLKDVYVNGKKLTNGDSQLDTKE